MFYVPALSTRTFAPRASNRAFERFASQVLASAPRTAVDVTQDEASWTLSLDVPGLSREDLSIGIEGAVVRIESKPEAKRAVKAAYELPLDIDVGSSEAKLENGVLTLKLGKRLPVSNVAQLAIN
ncbi:MAG: Hsp20/alpha crystallin family protein [Comamonadaceae bacterium]|nr:MAG: Hsp20/alpha crystallin family protein [Comamonadaceae bacterium]